MANTRRSKRRSSIKYIRGGSEQNLNTTVASNLSANNISGIKHSLEKAFNTNNNLNSLDKDDFNYIEKLKERVKGMGISEIQLFIINNDLMQLESTTSDFNSYGPSAEELNNNMKIGWLVHLLGMPTEKLKQANNLI